MQILQAFTSIKVLRMSTQPSQAPVGLTCPPANTQDWRAGLAKPQGEINTGSTSAAYVSRAGRRGGRKEGYLGFFLFLMPYFFLDIVSVFVSA